MRLAGLVVMMGTLLTGIITGFIGEVKRLMSFTTLGKWIGKKWTSMIDSFKTNWAVLIDKIKGRKLVTNITAAWQKFTAKLSSIFTPLMEWIGIGGKAAGEVKPKEQGRMMKLLGKFKKFFTAWPRTLAIGKALGRLAGAPDQPLV